jgi:hypothetical protein
MASRIRCRLPAIQSGSSTPPGLRDRTPNPGTGHGQFGVRSRRESSTGVPDIAGGDGGRHRFGCCGMTSRIRCRLPAIQSGSSTPPGLRDRTPNPGTGHGPSGVRSRRESSTGGTALDVAGGALRIRCGLPAIQSGSSTPPGLRDRTLVPPERWSSATRRFPTNRHGADIKPNPITITTRLTRCHPGPPNPLRTGGS